MWTAKADFSLSHGRSPEVLSSVRHFILRYRTRKAMPRLFFGTWPCEFSGAFPENVWSCDYCFILEKIMSFDAFREARLAKKYSCILSGCFFHHFKGDYSEHSQRRTGLVVPAISTCLSYSVAAVFQSNQSGGVFGIQCRIGLRFLYRTTLPKDGILLAHIVLGLFTAACTVAL